MINQKWGKINTMIPFSLLRKVTLKEAVAAYIFLILLFMEFIPLQAFAVENPLVLKEAYAWKLKPEEEMAVTFFPCEMVEESCRRFKIKLEEGFYKAYFPDGFVLSLSSSGKVLEYYYCVSENNRIAFEENLEILEKFNEAPATEKMKLRIEDMKVYLKAEEVGRESCGDAKINPLLSKIFNDLYSGKYNDVVESITKIIDAGMVKEKNRKMKLF